MAAETDGRNFRATAPYFFVRDLSASLDYYHKSLGFDRPRLWGEPPTFAMPSRDGFTFMLKQAEPGTRLVTSHDQGGPWDAYVWIRDSDALFAEFKRNGAVFEYEPRVQHEYDMKEFAVRDPDGHVIAFGQHHEA